MMPMSSSYMGASQVSQPPSGYASDAMFLDDLSNQISMNHPRRYSRGSNGHGQYAQHVAGQHVAGSVRVAKPSTSSASNSPRSAIMQARRRTFMNDGLVTRRNQQLLEQAYLPTPVSESSIDDPMKRSARPVSWHPSSSQVAQHQLQLQVQAQQQPQAHQQQQPSPVAQYPFPSYSDLDFFAQYQRQYPPTPTIYSEYGSPINAFSPITLPKPTLEPPRYLSNDGWLCSSVQRSNGSMGSPTDCPGLLEPTSQCSEQSTSANTTPSDTASQWNSFVANGFDKSAAPPTPDNRAAASVAEPVITSDESIPYQALEDDEEEGEILIGMGLYDPPEKLELEILEYRSPTAPFLGTGYNYPEPQGKGLKLEDAWEPPVKDDEDEDEDDEEDADDNDDNDDEANGDKDAEGDEQNE